MPKASTADRVIEAAYDCVVEKDGWNQLFASYAELVGADSGLIYLTPRVGVAGMPIASVNYDLSSKLAKFLAYYEAISPVHALYRKLPEAQIRAVGEFAFSSDFRETEFFQDWARPQGYADMLGGHLVRTSQIRAWLSLRRAEQRGVYTLAEIRAAEQVAPHLTRAIKLRCRLEEERSRAAGFREALEALGFGILIVDASAKVLMANRAADSILRAGDCLRSHHGRLTCVRPQETSAVHHAIRALTQVVTATDLYVSRCDGRRPLTLHFIPISSLSAWKGFAPATGIAAIFLIDPTSSVANVGGFAATYGLTAAECGVLREIVECGGLVRAAKALRIAVPTARTHLQHIFLKTSTNNQAELIQLVMRSSLHLHTNAPR
jgi:DNA-binding CsgD family transcriptional regulator